ncbi:MAG TPA: hypothetical protein VGQ83_12470 [Polyangia bacterium]|jgi:tetratricopeptide (TPR) repeat protein
MRYAALLASVLLFAGAPARADQAAPASPRELIERGDHLYRGRTGPQHVWEAISLYEQALVADPRSYDALWRLGRAFSALSGATDKAQRRDYGARGLVYAEQAMRLAPDRIEGCYYAATSLGLYASGLGVIRAVREHIQKRFLKLIHRAMTLDPVFDNAAPLMVYGRYFYELPWPLRDLDQSLRYLNDARRRGPAKIRTVLYLADTLLAKGDRDAALRQLETCVKMDPTREDAWDGRAMIKECSQALARERRK